VRLMTAPQESKFQLRFSHLFLNLVSVTLPSDRGMYRLVRPPK
jgi:hypothetical protein